MSADDVIAALASMSDWPRLVQEAAERHLEACYEAEEAYELGDDDVESPACAPFCGCITCVVREVLYAAWPIIQEHREDG